jgi:4-hydroxy-tetrahydrodipicolinate synthase
MVTPFRDDRSIDFPALKKLIDHLIDNGIDYLVSLGTTGEAATLSRDEKREVFRFTAEAANGRVPLVAGIGGNDTRQVTEDISRFDTTGYAAILSASPHYNKPIQEGIYQHYKAISEASALPVILYNVPSRTGSNVTAETTVRIARDFKNIIAIKEASGNFEQCNAIFRDKPENFLVISGDDPITLPLMAMGAAGAISVVGNALPKLLSSMVNLCRAGKFNEATPVHLRLLEITRLCFTEGSPGGVKEALKRLSICSNTLRLPLVNVSQETASLIGKELQKLAN